jgi:hypothetical protein
MEPPKNGGFLMNFQNGEVCVRLQKFVDAFSIIESFSKTFVVLAALPGI